MTSQEFIAFYPQFTSFSPTVVLTEYVRQANARFMNFGEDAEEARRLFTAHKLTRYLMTVPTPAASGSSASSEELAESGSTRQITGKRVGEVSVTYAAGASPASSSSFSDLSETVYGSQLLLLIRLYSMTEYVP